MMPGGFVPDFSIPVSIDARRGRQTVSTVLQPGSTWGLSNFSLDAGNTLLPAAPSPRDWADPAVGWGLILPERPGLSTSQSATADDAPEPIRELLKARSGRVFRYRTDSKSRRWTLRDYSIPSDLFIAASPPGTGSGELPMYLLIYATPAEIGWEVQYALNCVRHVGRLDLIDDGLANYISALIGDWPGSAARFDAPVVWSVDLQGNDITSLMRTAIAEPVVAALNSDKDSSFAATTYVNGANESATIDGLTRALVANRPALVLTSSHGQTAPLSDLAALTSQVGIPLDQLGKALEPAALLTAWQPDGAIWYAQACCSAGTKSPSSYADLFAATDPVGEVLRGVAGLGSLTAPLPRALLGAAKPLRAFIGRVEPTFNWTLQFPPSKQALGDDLVSALYQGLCSGAPVGLAFERFYDPIGALLLLVEEEKKRFAAGDFENPASLALYLKVCALDRAGLVILGDPTAALPLPAADQAPKAAETTSRASD